mgnify:CR=1 FL=1
MTKKFLKDLMAALIIIFGVFCFISIQNNYDNYDVKIDINLENLSSKEIDEYLAKDIRNEFIKNEKIKDITIFSKENNCSVYFKIKNSVLNKENTKNDIQKGIYKLLSNKKNINKITTEYDYNLKYQTFLVLTLKNENQKDSYLKIKKISDEILSDIGALKITSKISLFGVKNPALYLYFKDSDLVQYDLSLEDIKNLIKKNNLLETSTTKTNDFTSRNINLNSSIKNEDDLKNISLNFKNKLFATTFSQIFNITKEIQKPQSYLVSFDDKESVVFALSKKSFYPNFLFDLKLKNFAKNLDKLYGDSFEYKILNTNELEKIEVFTNKNASINYSFNLYSRLCVLFNENKIENVLYFISKSCPKISKNELYFEDDKNKITLLVSKNKARKVRKILENERINYLKKNEHIITLYSKNLDILSSKISQFEANFPLIINETTNKTLQIDYLCDKYNYSDYFISKKDIKNTLFSMNDGLKADYYFDGLSSNIPIILKNEINKKDIFVYSKTLKSLISLNTLCKTSYEEKFETIVRKNNSYYANFYIDLKNNHDRKILNSLIK